MGSPPARCTEEKAVTSRADMEGSLTSPGTRAPMQQPSWSTPHLAPLPVSLPSTPTLQAESSGIAGPARAAPYSCCAWSHRPPRPTAGPPQAWVWGCSFTSSRTRTKEKRGRESGILGTLWLCTPHGDRGGPGLQGFQSHQGPPLLSPVNPMFASPFPW